MTPPSMAHLVGLLRALPPEERREAADRGMDWSMSVLALCGDHDEPRWWAAWGICFGVWGLG